MRVRRLNVERAPERREIATQVLECHAFVVCPPEQRAEFGRLVEELAASLVERAAALGATIHASRAVVRDLTKQESIAQPRRIHLRIGDAVREEARWLCEGFTPHVSKRNLTDHASEVTCRHCLRLLEVKKEADRACG